MRSKVVFDKGFNSGRNDFTYGATVRHVGADSDFGGFLSLDLFLHDRTDTATSCRQTINTISAEDLSGMIDVLEEARQAVWNRQKAIDDFNQAKKAMKA